MLGLRLTHRVLKTPKSVLTLSFCPLFRILFPLFPLRTATMSSARV